MEAVTALATVAAGINEFFSGVFAFLLAAIPYAVYLVGTLGFATLALALGLAFVGHETSAAHKWRGLIAGLVICAFMGVLTVDMFGAIGVFAVMGLFFAYHLFAGESRRLQTLQIYELTPA